MKSSPVRINSQMSNNIAQTMQKAQNCSQSYACYRVQITLKKCSFKKTEYSIKLKIISLLSFRIALAQAGNNFIHFVTRSGSLSMTFLLGEDI